MNDFPFFSRVARQKIIIMGNGKFINEWLLVDVLHCNHDEWFGIWQVDGDLIRLLYKMNQ